MIGIDTWFFVQLIEGNSKAREFWKGVLSGRRKVMLSVVVLYETGIQFYRRNNAFFYQELVRRIQDTPTIRLLDLTMEAINEALKLKNTYNTPTLDALIVGTYLANRCKKVLSQDAHFRELRDRNVISLKSL